MTELALIIIAAALCILVLMLVSVFQTIKKSAASLGLLAEMLNGELKPALHELTSVLSELKTVSSGMAERTDDVKLFMAALGETGTNISTINRSLGVVTSALSATSMWAAGARAAGKFVLESYLKKMGGK